MFGNLSGKVAIVTGSGKGIGAGIARVFGKAGAKVMVATRTSKSGAETVSQAGAAGGVAELIAVDIGELANVEAVVNHTVDSWGGVDILVHNAASLPAGGGKASSEADLDTVLSINLKA